MRLVELDLLGGEFNHDEGKTRLQSVPEAKKRNDRRYYPWSWLRD
jgi:hypothetical protein